MYADGDRFLKRFLPFLTNTDMALTLLGQHHPLASPTEQLKMLGRTTSCFPFETQLDHIGLLPLRATGITVFQINVGKLCNQTCRHCHVDAGPDRTESMSRETAEQCIRALAKTIFRRSISRVEHRNSTPIFAGWLNRAEHWVAT